ncbi:DUF423 domain-containing protein [Candidatus Rariloculus sp.]|uniref:DUF423 domain-containing protein n=1 Tax=Candidatus Rariloculus sp. TaxID=3101265 RepID=UPI003D14F929
MSLVGKILLAVAALSLFVATALGAYAAHGLDAVLEPRALETFRTAVDYQFYHGLGMLAVAALGERYEPAWQLKLAGWLFAAGTVLFSGTIYATALGAPDWLGSATPAGGLCFMAGWLVCAYAVWRAAPIVLR